MRDQFTKLIKSILAENPTDPPVEVWENITNGLDLNEVWNSLETQLDLNNVWEGVSESIQHTHQIKWYDQFSYISSAAILALFLTYSAIDELNVIDSPAQTEALTDNSQAPIVPIIKDNQDAAQEDIPNEASNELPQVSPGKISGNSAALSSAINNTPGKSLSVANPNSGNDKVLWPGELSPSNTTTISAFEPKSLSPKLDDYPHELPIILTDRKLDLVHSNSSRLYVGIAGGLKNNWLINSKTINNFDSKSLNSTVLDVNSEMGLLVGYNLNEKYALQLETYLYSGEGQRYNEYIGGNYLPTSIDLEYQKLEALIKKRQSANRISFAYLFGITVAHLSEASETIGDDKTPIDTSFSKFNVGLSGGYEMSLNISPQWSINPSLRVRYGLNNVFRKNQSETNFLSSSKTASVGFNMGVQYHFR